jgi:hypothetical protein
MEFPAPANVPFQPFIARVVFGILVGGAMPVSILLIVRFALILLFTNTPL